MIWYRKRGVPCPEHPKCKGRTQTYHLDAQGKNGFWSCDLCGAVDNGEPCTCVQSPKFCRAKRHWTK